MTADTIDAYLVREVVERWSLYRDAGQFDRLPTLFHADGCIYTLWFQGTNDRFVERASAIFSSGMASVHYLCGSNVDIAANRAVARTNSKTYGRGEIDGQQYDCEATSQFFDLLEKREGRWAIVERWVVHIKDRLDPTDPGLPLQLDQALLDTQPPEYRHLAYLHARAGRAIKPNMPGLAGESARELKARSEVWLAAGPLPAPF